MRREFDETSETPAPTKALIWLQYTDAGDPHLIRGSKIPTDVSRRLDSGLRKLIFHWNQKGWLSQLYVILHKQPVHFVTALVDEPCAGHPCLSAPPISVPSNPEWTRPLVTGCLLSSMALYQEALPYLSQAVAVSDAGHDRGVSLIALAAAKLEIGDRELRKHALEHARAAQRELEPEWQSLYYRAQFLAATAARLAGSQDPKECSKTLSRIFQCCRDKENQDASLSELASDILVELRRWGRHVRPESVVGTAPSADYEPLSQDEYLDYVTKKGLLKAKGVDLHERARAEWEAAGSPEALKQVLLDMKSAAELRRDLGDIRGLCASLVLCGHLYLRQCDWPGEHINPTDIVDLRDRAKEAYLESYNLAKTHGLLWDIVQAAISVAIVYAWREQNCGAAFYFLQEAGQHPGANDAGDNLRIDFVQAMLPLLISPKISDSAPEAMQKFSSLETHHQGANGRVARRMRTAAKINAVACHSCVVANGAPALDMRQKLVSLAEEGLSKREEKTIKYWVDRVWELANVLERCEWRDSGHQLVAALIDPLPP